ncbi:MAG: hypothetical protein KDH15_20490, partial [Rhodocyclaceae bacterium]|nr:hypothetical protein [Rhodocyclaceae bacterium]
KRLGCAKGVDHTQRFPDSRDHTQRTALRAGDESGSAGENHPPSRSTPACLSGSPMIPTANRRRLRSRLLTQ